MQEFSLNHLTDTEFEQFCYDLLSELKFINLNWRKGTGYSSSPSDRGRDIECQHTHEDIDGTVYLETWFVECKHYQQGVPPDKIQGALAWAAAERPDKLLIIASNFLSNPNKDHLESFIRNNKPGFRIKYWEKPDLERLTLDKPRLLRKYKLGGNTTTINDYAEMNFVKEFIDFEKNLRIVLLMLKIETPRSQFASVLKMWQLFTKFVGDIDEQYNTVIKEATNVRNKYVHGAEVSYTLDDFTELTKQLEAVSDFVRNYGIKNVSQSSSPSTPNIHQEVMHDLIQLKRDAGVVTEKLCGYGAIEPMAEDIFAKLSKIHDMSGILLEFPDVVQPIRDFATSGAWFLKRRKEQNFDGDEREKLVEELTARHKTLVEACNRLIGQIS
jgi:hypothetical protein